MPPEIRGEGHGAPITASTAMPFQDQAGAFLLSNPLITAPKRPKILGLAETETLMALLKEKPVKTFMKNWKPLMDSLREKGKTGVMKYGSDKEIVERRFCGGPKQIIDKEIKMF